MSAIGYPAEPGGRAALLIEEARRRHRRRQLVWMLAAVVVSGGVAAAISFGPGGGSSATSPSSRATGEVVSVRRTMRRGTIRWLFRHEPRGQSLTQAGISLGALIGSHWQPVRFARVLRPDPTKNIRIAVSLIGKRGLNICMTAFQGRGIGGGCAVGLSLAPFNAQVSIGSSRARSALVSGLASDTVAHMSLLFANGTHLPVPLRDNAFAILAPRSGPTARLVAYDSRGHVIGIDREPMTVPTLR